MGWLIALGVLTVLAILPLGVSALYGEQGLLVRLILGPVRLTVLPKKKKENTKETKPIKSGSAKKEKKEEPAKKDQGGSITDFLPLVKTALALLNDLRRKLRVKRLELKIIMAGDDPCDLAVNYGRAWAAIGNLMPQLERIFVIKKRDIEVECDFTSSQSRILGRLDMTITLGRLLYLLVRYGFRALKQYLSIMNLRKGGAKT